MVDERSMDAPGQPRTHSSIINPRQHATTSRQPSADVEERYPVLNTTMREEGVPTKHDPPLLNILYDSV